MFVDKFKERNFKQNLGFLSVFLKAKWARSRGFLVNLGCCVVLWLLQ